jgi:hypothetical protein
MPAHGATPSTLARSLRAMTLGTVKSYNDRRDQYAAEALGEIDQQFQVTLSGGLGGLGGGTAAWGELELAFSVPFVNGSEDRSVPFAYPLVTYGSVVTSGGPLMVACNVKRWKVDEDYVLGATLEIGVLRTDGGGDYGVYAGELHLNFQGWGAPNPPEADIEGMAG